MKQIHIKEVLNDDAYDKIVSSCKQFQKQKLDTEERVSFCKEQILNITPADNVEIFFPSSASSEIILSTIDKKLTINTDTQEESCILQAYKDKQAFILNDPKRSFLYNPKIDIFDNISPKSILLFPIVDKGEQKHIIALVYASINKGNFNQFIQKDLDYLKRFSMHMRKTFEIEGEDNIGENESLEYKHAYEEMKLKNEHDQAYFSAIAHDIRTPMNAVLGYLELLLLKKQNPEERDYISAALKSGETMVALINDALDLSKISSGKMNIEKINFSPFKEFSDVAKLFFNTARKKEIYFHTYMDPQLPAQIHTDYHRIKQIINNLLSNALKFTPKEGTITLEILYNNDKDALTVNVKDTGIGIAKERQFAIFSAYTQENDSTSREYGGTGLGLNISQQLAVLLGGAMKLESEEGKGSKFFFEIPCHTPAYKSAFKQDVLSHINILLLTSSKTRQELQTIRTYLDAFAPNYKNSSDPKEALGSSDILFDILIVTEKVSHKYKKEIQGLLDTRKSVLVISDIFTHTDVSLQGNVGHLHPPFLPHELYASLTTLSNPDSNKRGDEVTLEQSIEDIRKKKLTSLVVDDSPVNLKFMHELLKMMGVDTIYAKNGKEASEVAETSSVDIIFMDANMPKMNGYDATIQIRKDEEIKQINKKMIIGLSGDASADSKEAFLLSGADIVLTKPVRLQEITDAILQAF